MPTPEDSNVLYNQFGDGTYPVTYQSYLGQHVFSAARNRPGDAPHPNAVVPCGNYGGQVLNLDFATVIGAMHRGDALFLALEGGAVGHAMGVYRGTDYLFVFDPNSGLYKGTGWQHTRCFTVVDDDVTGAAQYLQNQCQVHHWQSIHYFGNHLRA